LFIFPVSADFTH